jgi:hypothetical protein
MVVTGSAAGLTVAQQRHRTTGSQPGRSAGHARSTTGVATGLGQIQTPDLSGAFRCVQPVGATIGVVVQLVWSMAGRDRPSRPWSDPASACAPRSASPPACARSRPRRPQPARYGGRSAGIDQVGRGVPRHRPRPRRSDVDMGPAGRRARRIRARHAACPFGAQAGPAGGHRRSVDVDSSRPSFRPVLLIHDHHGDHPRQAERVRCPRVGSLARRAAGHACVSGEEAAANVRRRSERRAVLVLPVRTGSVARTIPKSAIWTKSPPRR